VKITENFWVGNLKGQKLSLPGLFGQFWSFGTPYNYGVVVVGLNFFCWRFWVVARRKQSSYAKVMASQGFLSKTDQTVQFRLTSDWTSGNRGQANLDADLTFFGFFFRLFFTSDRNYLMDSGNSTGETGRHEQNLILLGWETASEKQQQLVSR
jgi:hypothetical protein